MSTHDGKSVKFGKPKISGKKTINYHFEVHHYAGTVGYNIDSWLDKNKDPINEAVAQIFAKSGDAFIASLWKDYATEGKFAILCDALVLFAVSKIYDCNFRPQRKGWFLHDCQCQTQGKFNA